jgi:hypothetical protein
VKWIAVEEVARRFNVDPIDIRALVARGALAGIEFPHAGLKVRLDTVRRLEEFLRPRPVARDKPGASQEIWVGEWVLPSGRHCEFLVGPSRGGLRSGRLLYDRAEPLTDEDRQDLDARVLPALAQRLEALTGRRGRFLAPPQISAAAPQSTPLTPSAS